MPKVNTAIFITVINVLVLAGFSIVGVLSPQWVLPDDIISTEDSRFFAFYAVVQTVPLALLTLCSIYKKALTGVLIFGCLAGLVAFGNAAVLVHNIEKSGGFLALCFLQIYATFVMRKHISNVTGLNKPRMKTFL